MGLVSSFLFTALGDWRLFVNSEDHTVLVISVVDTIDKAIELANSTDYSLTASGTHHIYGLQIAKKIAASACIFLRRHLFLN